MNEKLDNILASEPELVPFSGFLGSVMERVVEEAAAPPPIPFPSKRAIPGMIVAAGVFGWGGFEFVRYAIHDAPLVSLPKMPVPAHIPAQVDQVLWAAFACAVSLASWLLARRLAGRSGLI
jgi:hypothetical protein